MSNESRIPVRLPVNGWIRIMGSLYTLQMLAGHSPQLTRLIAEIQVQVRPNAIKGRIDDANRELEDLGLTVPYPEDLL